MKEIVDINFQTRKFSMPYMVPWHAGLLIIAIFFIMTHSLWRQNMTEIIVFIEA